MKKRRTFLTAAAALLAAVTVWTYGAIHSEEWVVSSERVPEAFDGLRITLLTDLHGVELGADNGRLLAAVQKAQPDLIAISGDLLHENTNYGKMEPLLRQLTEIAPTWFVTGNHEWGREDTEEVLRQMEEVGVQVLRSEYTVLERDGQKLVVAGTDDLTGRGNREKPEQLMKRLRQEVGGDPYVVMLHHRNDTLGFWQQQDTDLVLAGHGHGGVIRLPLVGGLLSVNRTFFPQDAYGLYEAGRTTLAVSRGLGGVRLWNRPHLPTVELRCKNP